MGKKRRIYADGNYAKRGHYVEVEEPPTATVTLTNADEACVFGERRSIEDMMPEEAIALFGLPLYESWLKHRNGPKPPQGYVTVTSIDRDTATLTMGYGPLPSGGKGDEG